MPRRFSCFLLASVLLTGSFLRAQTLIVNDTTTQYSIGIQNASAPCYGTCDLSPSYNNYVVSSAFSITKITFNWSDPGGNNCDQFGHYGATISASNSASGLLASSINNIYMGCGGSGGAGELDFAGQTIPKSFYLDFLSLDGGLQGGAAINLTNVEIWGNSIVAGERQVIGLPILFVHGICDGVDGFLPAETAVKTYLQQQLPTLYPDLTQGSPAYPNEYVAFFKGTSVEIEPEGLYETTSKVNAGTRFFLVDFNDGVASDLYYPDFDGEFVKVASISVLEKGNELAEVIWRVKALTGAPRVILVTHSMGGIDARAYIENLSAAEFNNDVAALVTLDATHGGADLASIPSIPSNSWSTCFATDSVNKSEITPGSTVLQALNYQAEGATALPPDLMITSIESYWSPINIVGSIFLDWPYTDNVLSSMTQDLGTNLSNASGNSKSLLLPEPNEFESIFFANGSIIDVCGVDQPLHFLTCTGSAQQTFDLIENGVIPAAAAISGQFQVTPAALTVPPGATQIMFNSTAGPQTIWSVLEGNLDAGVGGAITQQPAQNAYYSAPESVPPGGSTFHIVAINGANPSQYAEAAVRVLPDYGLVSQTIDFTQVPTPLVFGVLPMTLSATASSGLGIKFSVLSGPATITNTNVLTITGPGEVVMAAIQTGNTTYAAAQATQTLWITDPAPGLLFNQTDSSAGSLYSNLSGNWYQLGTGFSGVLHSIDIMCAVSDGAGPTINLSEFEDSGYGTLTNSYPLPGADGGPACPAQMAQVHLANLNIPIWPTRYYRLDTGANLQYSDVTILGTTSEGFALDVNWYYGEGNVDNYYTFYPFILSNLSNQSELTSPVPGSTLAGPSATFTWTAVTGATSYDLWLGTNGVGSNNLWGSGATTATSVTFGGLPTNGETVYVRLFATVNGMLQHLDYTYTAASAAVLTSPTPGSTFTSSSVTFTWTAASGATEYALWLGSTGVGSNNLGSSGGTTSTSFTKTGLPTTGEKIYVRLWTMLSGSTLHADYTYNAASQAVLTAPTLGSTFTGSSETFTWSTVNGATEYALWLGSTGVGSNNLGSSGGTTATSYTKNGLPTNGEPIYVRLFTIFNGVDVHTDYVYTADTAGP